MQHSHQNLPPLAGRVAYTGGVLRAAFWGTALLFVPAGLLLYFLSPTLAAQVGLYPMWLARMAGGILLAWGSYQLAAGLYPDPVKVGGLVAGNLLTVATLVPALLRQGGSAIPAKLSMIMMSLCMTLVLLAVLAMLAYPRRAALGLPGNNKPGDNKHG